MKKIITISREFGACGTTVGRALATRLGYDMWDKAIPLNGQKDSNIRLEDLVEFDEKVPVSFSFGQSLFELHNTELSNQIFRTQTEVIRKMGEHGSCVIVGRNAGYILKEYDSLLRVLLYADTEFRIAHMEGLRPDYTEEQMRSRLAQVDKAREKYCSFYTHSDFHDVRNYDICLDIGRLGMDAVVETLYQLAVH